MSMCMVHAWVGGSPASGVREVARHGWALESGPAARATLILDPYSCTDTGNGLAGSAVGCHIASSTIAPGSPGAPYEPRVPAICTINGRRWSRSCGGSSLTKPAWHSAPRADGGCADLRFGGLPTVLACRAGALSAVQCATCARSLHGRGVRQWGSAPLLPGQRGRLLRDHGRPIVVERVETRL